MNRDSADLTANFLHSLTDYVCAAIYIVCIVMLGWGFAG